MYYSKNGKFTIKVMFVTNKIFGDIHKSCGSCRLDCFDALFDAGC